MLRSRLMLKITMIALFAIALIPSSSARAQTVDWTEPQTEGELDCRYCHINIYYEWEKSIHGQGLSCGQCHLAGQDNHSRTGHGAQEGPGQCMSCHTTGYNPEDDTWEEDNVHCKACHSPIEPNHPDAPMPTDRSENLCGKCHIEALFEWQESMHRSEGITCVSCHSQHTTSVRWGETLDQCAACHGLMVAEYKQTAHYKNNLACSSCHLTPLEGPIGEGSAKLDHSFKVDLQTCKSCHFEDLHHPGESMLAESHDEKITSEDARISKASAQVTTDPEESNTMQIFAFIGAIGVGIVLANTNKITRLIKNKNNGND